MQFEYPWVFITLLLFIICYFTCKPQSASVYMSLFTYKKAVLSYSYLAKVLRWIGIVSLITALASPVNKEPQVETKPAHAVVMLMDTSESMTKESRGFFGGSVTSDKFEKAKAIGAKYIEQRVNDHVGIIVFGDFAYVASPLSFDHKSTAMLLEQTTQGVAGNKTAMFDALFLSARLLKDSEAKEKVAILLTDGFNTSGKIPLDAAIRAIKSENIKVFAIGLGKVGEFDSATLQYIAKESGGAFFQSLNADGLKEVYEKIEQIQKAKLKSEPKYNTEYLYIYPLLLSFFALLFSILLDRRGV